MIPRFRTLAVALLTILAFGTTAPAVAQSASRVQFEAGNDKDTGKTVGYTLSVTIM